MEKPDTYFPDLISIWALAVEVKNDSILSVVPAVLALFLKTISFQLQFRTFGLSLCRTLLLKDQLRLLDQGLTATKRKGYLISPCLRLLTEIVGFDGGALASSIYSRREFAFKRLETFLDHRTSDNEHEEDDPEKSTLRRIAQGYVLANLKFQNSSAKSDMIAQGKIFRALLKGMDTDRADILLEILQAIERHILTDAMLSRNTKTRFFNQGNLGSLSSIYGVRRQTRTRSVSNSITYS